MKKRIAARKTKRTTKSVVVARRFAWKRTT